MAARALHAHEAVGENPASQVLVELFFDEVRERLSSLFADQAQESLEIFLDDFVEYALFGLVALVDVLVLGGGLHGWRHASCAGAPSATTLQ